ncbi:GGDEF domain-containing response regulator [Athalassotoga saccharophila]|uniref:GGDEF domain-containing response regulator n=1 Tax=Athalassotoga saccharophila TaxID=1441386 RepID=UPI00137B0EC6|nr:diguanylate cyclase [Athalassotoga saccharophila]BBJ27727.1 response regulator PleD [Athalassotoga saccharophila]
MKILIVDDSEFWRKILGDIFKDHEVEFAGDGLEGYFKIHEFCPDLVISDLVMPGLNGYLLCRIVKNTELKDIPFVIMTASSDSIDKFWGKYAGASEYIQKDSEDGIKRLKDYVASLRPIHECKRSKDDFKSSFERALNGLLVKSTIENEIRKFFIHIDDMNYVVRKIFDFVKSMFEIDDGMILIFKSDSMDVYTNFENFEDKMKRIFENLKTPSNLERRITYLDKKIYDSIDDMIWVFHQDRKENGAIFVARKREFSNSEKEMFSNVMIEVENLLNVGLTFEVYRQYSFTDKLTGLNNLRALNDYLDELWKNREEFFFCMIDIDNFKRVNDTYGHETGNNVLSGIGNMIKHLPSDLFSARYGGEEIAIVSKRKDLVEIVESLRSRIESTHFGPVKVTISAGIALSSGANSYTEVIEMADAALYRAKHEGKNRVVVAK